jgi:hypothetical protein
MDSLTVVSKDSGARLVHQARELLGRGVPRNEVSLDVAMCILQENDKLSLMGALDAAHVIVHRAWEHVVKGGKVDGARAWYALVAEIRNVIGERKGRERQAADLSRFSTLYAALNPDVDGDVALDVAEQAIDEAVRQLKVGGMSRA